MTENRNLGPGLQSALSRAGKSWTEIFNKSKEIVLFGSRAAGVESVDSDWDILCVGQGLRFNKPQVDIVWIRPEKLSDPDWLGSELAGHVSKYGIWFKGEGRWRSNVFVSENTKRHKGKKIKARISGLSRSWPYLSEEYRLSRTHKLRQDVQRLIILKSDEFVPPSQILDSEWKEKLDVREKVKTTLASLAGKTQNKRFVRKNIYRYM